MPGIKIVRKNRLKSVNNISKEKVEDNFQSQQDSSPFRISTPGKQQTEVAWDKVGT